MRRAAQRGNTRSVIRIGAGGRPSAPRIPNEKAGIWMLGAKVLDWPFAVIRVQDAGNIVFLALTHVHKQLRDFCRKLRLAIRLCQTRKVTS